MSVTARAPTEEAPLTVRDLSVHIEGAPVVDGVTLDVRAGETVALVGESGCGKSMTALAVMGLLPPAAHVDGGTIRINGSDTTRQAEHAMQRLRGDKIAMIFQEPVSSLNPLMRVGAQIVEALLSHRRIDQQAARRAAIEMIDRVGIPDPETRFRQYPFELSGGMCQRVMIAIALICEPAILIADEPTTALDVTIQAQILDLMRALTDETGTALLLITHDMGVVADMADRVAVMYAGRIVETAPARALFARQRHPYTRLLLGTIPKVEGQGRTLLPTIEGVVPDMRELPVGCRFHPRCPLAGPRCRQEAPPLAAAPDDPAHESACWFADRVGEIA
ncbi:peptide ABC transporter ATP-binding protein [Rhodobacteraceae bacterium WD3A24]|nr:peptide ABC transporter ATP-binding protein [Rhodobacteraceae bacterium WD3A24]